MEMRKNLNEQFEIAVGFKLAVGFNSCKKKCFEKEKVLVFTGIKQRISIFCLVTLL